MDWQIKTEVIIDEIGHTSGIPERIDAVTFNRQQCDTYYSW